jgi:hypothetical protein
MNQVTKRRSLFLWKLNFYGLTQEYRAGLFRILHEIVFYGRGGYSYEDVYNFPIWLRRVTYNFIVEYTQKEQDAQNQATSKSSKGGQSVTNLDWVPNKSKQSESSYTTKATRASKK